MKNLRTSLTFTHSFISSLSLMHRRYELPFLEKFFLVFLFNCKFLRQTAELLLNLHVSHVLPGNANMCWDISETSMTKQMSHSLVKIISEKIVSSLIIKKKKKKNLIYIFSIQLVHAAASGKTKQQVA